MVNDGRTVIEAALAGHGIVLQDTNILEDHVATGRFVRLFPDYVGPIRKFALSILQAVGCRQSCAAS